MSCPSSLRPTAIVALCVTPFLACVAPRPRDSYRPEVASRDYLHSRGFVGEVQQGEVRRQEVLSIGETVYAAAPIEGGCLFAGGDRVASRRAWVARWENSRGVVWQQRLPDMGLVDSIAQVSSGLYAVSGEARPGYDLGITWVSHEGEAERFRRFGDYTPDGGLKSGAVDRGGILAVGPRGELFLAGAGDLRAYVVRIGGRFLTWGIVLAIFATRATRSPTTRSQSMLVISGRLQVWRQQSRSHCLPGASSGRFRRRHSSRATR